MNSSQINFNQERSNIPSFRLPKIDIDDKIDVKEKKKSFLGKIFNHAAPKATGDFSGPKSTFDQLEQKVKDSGARIETFKKQAEISIAKSRTEGATSDNMKSAIQWTKAMCLEGDKLSLYEAKLKLTGLVEIRDEGDKILKPFKEELTKLNEKLKKLDEKWENFSGNKRKLDEKLYLSERESIEKEINACKTSAANSVPKGYNKDNAAIPLLEQDIRVYEAKLEYRKMSTEELKTEARKLYEQAKTLRQEGKKFEVDEILRKFIQIQNIFLENANYENALAHKEFMDGVEKMTAEELEENIQIELANAKKFRKAEGRTKKESDLNTKQAINCMMRLNVYRSQLAAKEADLKKEADQKTKDLPDVPLESLLKLEERLAKLIVDDLPEVPDNDPNVALKQRDVAVAELEDWG